MGSLKSDMKQMAASETIHDQEQERSVKAAEAIEAAKRDIAALGYQCEVSQYGRYVPIYEARLFDEAGVLMARGTGKGRYPLSLAGALFEALEHLYGVTDLPKPEAMREMGIKAIAAQSGLEHYLPTRLLEAFPEQSLYCARFDRYGQEDEHVYLPSFLWLPDLLLRNAYVCQEENLELYAYMTKYASNSGVAAGMNVEDAVLHGINEGIERDGHGRLLYRYFYADDAGALPVIEKASLPADLKAEVKAIEKGLGDECMLIDATTDLGVPVIGAVFRKYHHEHRIPAPGFGASLYPDVAIRRAVYEALQIMSGAEAYPNERQRAAEEDLQRVTGEPRYERCVRFDLQLYDEKRGYQRMSYEQLHKEGLTLDVPIQTGEQIERLVYRLRQKGLCAYVHQLAGLLHGTTVMCTQIPGVSLFFLTSTGMMIAPEGRTIDT
ncbi:YcaO-like family protein [Poriferisphaera sp. WC338]|uniref:YcaO-like family protein n=1 Tax=Poriferisphaera sp. WC338 TaxID=3425129 RepID=UPI003D8154EF